MMKKLVNKLFFYGPVRPGSPLERGGGCVLARMLDNTPLPLHRPTHPLSRGEQERYLLAKPTGKLMMVKLVLISFVFVSFSALAQTGKKTADSAFFIIHDAPSAKSNPLYIINERRTKKQPKLKKEDLCDIYVLKASDAAKLYGKDAKDGAIVIVTTKFAVKRYQKKFREFSMEYRRYLDERNGDDSAIPYEIDGTYLRRDSTEKAKLLYDLNPNKIESIFFTDSYIDKGVKCVVMNIKTKTN